MLDVMLGCDRGIISDGKYMAVLSIGVVPGSKIVPIVTGALLAAGITKFISRCYVVAK